MTEIKKDAQVCPKEGPGKRKLAEKRSRIAIRLLTVLYSAQNRPFSENPFGSSGPRGNFVKRLVYGSFPVNLAAYGAKHGTVPAEMFAIQIGSAKLTGNHRLPAHFLMEKKASFPGYWATSKSSSSMRSS